MDVLSAFALSNQRCLSRAELLAMGLTPRQLAAAVHAEVLQRPRRGWYVRVPERAEFVVAIRVGGRATCISALEGHGLWTPNRATCHVWLPGNASRLRSRWDSRVPLAHSDRTTLRLHWRPLAFPGQCDNARVGILDALIQVVRCQPRAIAVAVVDSAVHTGAASKRDLDVLASHLTARQARILDHVDARAESGTESLVRLALRDAGFRVDPQVLLPGVGRVDLVVNRRIAVEVDSRAWHSSPEAQARDYDRDLAAVRSGFWPLRVSYEQAMFRRAEVVRAVRSADRAMKVRRVAARPEPAP